MNTHTIRQVPKFLDTDLMIFGPQKLKFADTTRLHSHHHHKFHGIYHVAMLPFNFGEYFPLPLYSALTDCIVY